MKSLQCVISSTSSLTVEIHNSSPSFSFIFYFNLYLFILWFFIFPLLFIKPTESLYSLFLSSISILWWYWSKKKVFFDDILVFSKSPEDHLQHLRALQKGQNANFPFRGLYLDHLIYAQGVKTDPTKIAAMLQRPIQKICWYIEGFTKPQGYYRKFIKGYIWPYCTPLFALERCLPLNWKGSGSLHQTQTQQ